MGRMEGRVAFITGAARGQGRAHAVRLAEEGADLILSDIADATTSQTAYPLGSAEELWETAKLVEGLGRRCVAEMADVRDPQQLKSVADAGVEALGRLDAVVANAGIWSSYPFMELEDDIYQNMIDVQMHGAYYTAKATVPILVDQDDGGSLIFINSTAGLMGFPYQAHYNMAKHAVVGLMRTLANELAPNRIRCNSIHPSAVDTKMIQNEAIWRAFRPDLEDPKSADTGKAFQNLNLLPIPWMDPVDISNAVLYLASEESRYVTGITLSVDAGLVAKV